MRSIGFGGVITFDPNLSGQTIDLVTGELVLDRSMNIDGSGLPVAITLDAGGGSRLFRASGEISASLSSLTLTGGFTARWLVIQELPVGFQRWALLLLVAGAAVRDGRSAGAEGRPPCSAAGRRCRMIGVLAYVSSAG